MKGAVILPVYFHNIVAMIGVVVERIVEPKVCERLYNRILTPTENSFFKYIMIGAVKKGYTAIRAMCP